MIIELENYEVVLASRSPRRKHLLKDMGICFRSGAVDTDETPPPGMDPPEVAMHLAREKAEAWPDDRMYDDSLIIAADTIVVLGGEILGKPVDAEDAVKMIRTLSGKSHDVITGVCIRTKEKSHCFHAISKVRFKPLREEEILHYVEKYQPFDKAGSYGIQEWIGLIGVEGIEGSYYNVMGLPTTKLWEELLDFIR